ncbi:MAG: hypothetical protein U0169_06405 [Polyangiaceae bacterium]
MTRSPIGEFRVRSFLVAATFALLASTSACSGEATGDDESSASASTKGGDQGTSPTKTGVLDVAEEEKVLRTILTDAIRTYEDKYGKRLGWGWYGNVTGQGDKCNVVSDQLSPIIDKALYANMRLRKAPFVHHDMVTIVAAGMLCEALSGHVYFALHRVDAATKALGERVVTFDPWRSESGFFETDPNTRPDAPIPWGIPKYVVPTDPPAKP